MALDEHGGAGRPEPAPGPGTAPASGRVQREGQATRRGRCSKQRQATLLPRSATHEEGLLRERRRRPSHGWTPAASRVPLAWPRVSAVRHVARSGPRRCPRPQRRARAASRTLHPPRHRARAAGRRAAGWRARPGTAAPARRGLEGCGVIGLSRSSATRQQRRRGPGFHDRSRGIPRAWRGPRRVEEVELTGGWASESMEKRQPTCARVRAAGWRVAPFRRELISRATSKLAHARTRARVEGGLVRVPRPPVISPVTMPRRSPAGSPRPHSRRVLAPPPSAASSEPRRRRRRGPHPSCPVPRPVLADVHLDAGDDRTARAPR